MDEEFEEIRSSKSSWNVLNSMKDWMITFLQTHGFWGVLLMSAWPNMAFDLCGMSCLKLIRCKVYWVPFRYSDISGLDSCCCYVGICCGHFLMPFWTFFGATLIGKAVIKVNMQAGMTIVACRIPTRICRVYYCMNIIPINKTTAHHTQFSSSLFSRIDIWSGYWR